MSDLSFSRKPAETNLAEIDIAETNLNRRPLTNDERVRIAHAGQTSVQLPDSRRDVAADPLERSKGIDRVARELATTGTISPDSIDFLHKLYLGAAIRDGATVDSIAWSLDLTMREINTTVTTYAAQIKGANPSYLKGDSADLNLADGTIHFFIRTYDPFQPDKEGQREEIGVFDPEKARRR
jgi:hypothetical protein